MARPVLGSTVVRRNPEAAQHLVRQPKKRGWFVSP